MPRWNTYDFIDGDGDGYRDGDRDENGDVSILHSEYH